MLSFLLVTLPTMDAQASQESKKTEAAMDLAYETKTESQAIPAIDAAATAEVETASFGLG
jgi:hypothetical protein